MQNSTICFTGNYLNSLLVFLFLNSSLFATTIIPYVNIGEMALGSDAVVLVSTLETDLHLNDHTWHTRTRFKVEQHLKGPLGVSQIFEMESASGFSEELFFEVSGDMEYIPGHSYLLFLRQITKAPYWEPVLMAYSVFEKVLLDKRDYLVPAAEGRSISRYQRPDGRVVEPLQAYRMQELLVQLRNVLTIGKEWDGKSIQLPSSLNRQLLEITAPPDHCTFFSARWLGFPDMELPVYAEDDGDLTISDFTQRVSDAVSQLSSAYEDINISYSGSVNYTPDCIAGGNNAYSATSGFFNALAGDRWILVMFDDPCDQIANLNIEITETTFSCEGTLARGGLYGYTPGHEYDGVNKNNGAYGYVVVNEQAGDCLLGSTVDYEYLLAHEITHSLGFNHISESVGVANMNPVCCNDLTGLDIACSEYYYGGVVLPVELIYFRIDKVDQGLMLRWETSLEMNNSHFVVERSEDGVHFYELGMVSSAVNTTDFIQDYHFLDEEPSHGLNYYRLRQVDLDGSTTYSEIRSTTWETGRLELIPYPNPHSSGDLQLKAVVPETGNIEVVVYQMDGKTIHLDRYPVEKGQNSLLMGADGWPAGIYFLKGIFKEQIIYRKLIVR